MQSHKSSFFLIGTKKFFFWETLTLVGVTTCALVWDREANIRFSGTRNHSRVKCKLNQMFLHFLPQYQDQKPWFQVPNSPLNYYVIQNNKQGGSSYVSSSLFLNLIWFPWSQNVKYSFTITAKRQGNYHRNITTIKLMFFFLPK